MLVGILATTALFAGQLEVGGPLRKPAKRASNEPSGDESNLRPRRWPMKGAHHAALSLDATLHLLAGNLALSYGEALTPFASRRSRGALREELALLDGITSQRHLEAALERRLCELDAGRSEFDAQIAACVQGDLPSRHTSLCLTNLQFLLNDIRCGQHVELRHINVAAWQIQHAARLLRIGVTLDWLSDAQVHRGLSELARHYRRHYSNWNDFSLSFLTVHALLSPIDVHDLGAWPSLAKSHFALIESAAATAPFQPV